MFAFYVNGQNIALIHGTPSTPVSINTVNDHTNSQFYRNNNFQLPDDAPLNTEMDGLTTVFGAQATVIPGSSNHIKLAIADTRDEILDSNVFIKATSLVPANSNGVASNVHRCGYHS